jgi:hypothetical protein
MIGPFLHPRIAAFLALTAVLLSAPAAADPWAWAPIRDGATLDAHLARADHARPNPLPVFETIAALADPRGADAALAVLDAREGPPGIAGKDDD